MRLLLDTHTLIWFYVDDPKLSVAAKVAILDPANTCFVSAATIWEIGILTGKGRLPWKLPLMQEIEGMLMGCDAEILSIEPTHVVFFASLLQFHKDPFDRMLIAQAVMENLTLVTCDQAIARYQVPTLW